VFRVPYDWLKEYVDAPLSSGELAWALSDIGVEVGAVESTSVENGDEGVVLDLEVTANRPDLLGIIGVAREVAAISGRTLTLPPAPIREAEQTIDALTSVDVQDGRGCPRYCARLITDVEVGPSPPWLARRLELVGMRPLNNVVDITNYVLMEYGQPLHPFDFDELIEKRIVVRRARPGEQIVTIDDVERTLTSDLLVIADAERPVALAGIMGGRETEIKPKTRNVLLESALFDPVVIRRGSKALKLETEASFRFERGGDPEAVISAIDRAAALIEELAGGTVVRGRIDCHPLPRPENVIVIRQAKVNQILGIDLTAGETARLLERLGFRVTDTASAPDGTMSVVVPSFRRDISREIDLVEEAGRLYGYANIPSRHRVREFVPARREREDKETQRLCELLVAQGCLEVISYSFIDPRKIDLLNLGPDDERRSTIRLRNPLSEELSVLRTSLIPGLLGAAVTNQHRRADNLRLFEIGKVFFSQGTDELPLERVRLGVLLMGVCDAPFWGRDPAPVGFYDLKGLIEGVLDGLRIGGCEIVPGDDPLYAPGQSAHLELDGEVIGSFGELASSVVRAFDLAGPVYVLDADVEGLIRRAGEVRLYEKITRYPAAVRDVAFVVEESIPVGDLLDGIREAAGNHLERIQVFDVYRGEQLPTGSKSVAFSLSFRAADRTLTDEEIDAASAAVVDLLRERWGAAVRGATPA